LTRKELYDLLYANGVPMQAIKWTFTEELDSSFLRNKLTPMLEDIETFLNNRKSFMLYFSSNPLLASRIAVTFMKAAFIAGYYKTKYTVPGNLVGYKLESWDNGDAYYELLTADLLVIDKVLLHRKVDSWPREVFEEFIEDRLMKRRSTLLVCGDNPNEVFNDRLRSLFDSMEIKIVSEEGISRVKQ
jgi:hypothetical protein